MTSLRRRSRASAPGSGREGWTFGLSVVEIGLTIVSASLVTLGGGSDAIRCPSFPSCLADQSTWIANLHAISAAVLLILAVAISVLSLGRYGSGRSFRSPPFLGLYVLFLTAGFGALFATGGLPLSLAPVQYLLLSMVVLLFGWTAVDAWRGRRAAAEAQRGPPEAGAR